MARVARLFLTACVLVSFAGSLSAQEPRAVGLVLEIVGPVYLRTTTRGAEVALDPQRDVRRALFEGQAIRCGPGGRVRVRLGSRVEELTAARGRFELRFAEPASDVERATLAALAAYGRPGGSRALGAVLHAPAHDSVVRLERLPVRWAPGGLRGPLNIELRNEAGRVVWTAGGIAAADSQLNDADSRALVAALRQASASAATTARWTIVVRDGVTVAGSATVRLLSRADEMSLTARLSAADQETDPVLRGITRAFAFSTLGLINDAADELDGLLPSAPRSEALLRAAIAAHARTGHTARVQALTARLDPVK